MNKGRNHTILNVRNVKNVIIVDIISPEHELVPN